jgi:D-serine deaminase-like pyridoxal phosphate-dependent protein
MTLLSAADLAFLQTAPTPSLVLDHARMMRNISRLRAHLGGLGVQLNPHLKTCKSVEVARLLLEFPDAPCTVSTLAEAEHFAAAGLRRILYAVGLAPAKLDRVSALRRQGVDLVVTLDSVEQAHAVALHAQRTGDHVPVLIEIDSDGHRAGVRPDDIERLLAIARALAPAELRGVLTHAGESYSCTDEPSLIAMAEQERHAAVVAAQFLRQAGFSAPVVSVGSTPTAHAVRDLSGVTEVRAGVFVFFDLVMTGIGVCTADDIALSVLTTVIGHKPERGWILVDAGWMAMSRDRGTAAQRVDQGYGLVCDVHGRPLPDLLMASANQEHGVLALRAGSGGSLPDLPVGTLLRILPNHACATGAQHEQYRVIAKADGPSIWPRFRGW